MGRRGLLTLVALITLAVIGVSLLLITMYIKYLLMPRHFHPLPGVVVFPSVYYGSLSCNNHFIIIPSNSMVVLRYHVHGNLTIDFINIGMAFPASIVNETLTALSGLHNPNDVLIMGVYVNGRLIAVNTSPNQIYGLRTAVSQFNGHIAVAYTSDAVNFPPINLTSGDVITVILYSAVPYALPSCAVINESSETELMIEGHVISAKFYEEGRYITEEPVIYIINATKPMSQLPQELTPNILANAKPLITNYAPTFIMGYVQLPQYVKVGSGG